MAHNSGQRAQIQEYGYSPLAKTPHIYCIKKGGTLSIHFLAYRNIYRVPPLRSSRERLTLSPNRFRHSGESQNDETIRVENAVALYTAYPRHNYARPFR